MSGASKSNGAQVFAYLPGLDGSGELIYAQEEELSTRYRVVRVPWRTKGRFRYGDLVTDVRDALDDAGAERAVIFAESFGGTVALQFALAHPERVDHLVVLNSFAYYPNRPLVKVGRALARLVPLPIVWALRAAVDIPTLALEGVPREARRRFLRAANAQPLAAYAQRLDLVEGCDLRERLQELSVPTLFLAAEHDRVVPWRESRQMAERVPGAAFELIPKVGHATLLTPGISLLRLIEPYCVKQRG